MAVVVPSAVPADEPGRGARALYERRSEDLRAAFLADGNGRQACLARSEATDDLLRSLWQQAGQTTKTAGLALLAIGGYGRQQLFPFSDVDLLFCTGTGKVSEAHKEAIRSLTQALWDCGLKVSPATRSLSDCDRFKSADPEFSLALLDVRFVTGSTETADALTGKILHRRSTREGRALAAAAAQLTRDRHLRFGNTLFHLEPNVKDAPGGLRDANICVWLSQLRGAHPTDEPRSFTEAVDFLTATRVFLHLRHSRDDNTLDWHAQDEAATQGIGLDGGGGAREGEELGGKARRRQPDAAAWMRAYFRQARAIERTLAQELERSDLRPQPDRAVRRVKAPPLSGFFVKDGTLELKTPSPGLDPAHESEIVLSAFSLLSATGVTLSSDTETRIGEGIPYLSATLEEGPRLWSRLRAVLVGPFAAPALREMHALGVLELILPEFHGIDALVIRDAYHRYTVDEHTFVLIDVLHGLAREPQPHAPEWRSRFRRTLLELPHLDLLLLAALLHDTGKGRTAVDHAVASGRLAASVCHRLQLGPYESDLVVRLIECHLEMSAALRRDIFDTETVRKFANKVQTHELLRMLTLFTYADISAVHPDALTPWKAENLWRLSMATANQLDRSVDEDRVFTREHRAAQLVDALVRSLGRKGGERDALVHFLDGFPERYLRTRSPDIIQAHLGLLKQPTPATLSYGDGFGEVTIVSSERPSLFADLAATLAGWGMDVITAEAFSNAHGTVVDTFRFADVYRTLELNPEERDRLLGDLGRAIREGSPPGRSGAGRGARRAKPLRVVETRLDFNNEASSHSTLLQIVTQNVPGLLFTAATVLSQSDCNVEVALIDTEGEMAIDVFYLTRHGGKLEETAVQGLRSELLEAIERNAG